MKSKKKRDVSLVIVGVILLFVVLSLGYFSTKQSVIPLPQETINEKWLGNDVKLTAVGGFKSNINTRDNPFYGNDGDVTINNDYSISDKLILETSVKTDRQQSDCNSIEAELDLPSGELTAKCYTSAKDDDWDMARAVCKINIDNSVLSSKAKNSEDISNEKTFNFVLNEPTKVKVELLSCGAKASCSSDASSRIVLSFDDKIAPRRTIMPDDELPGETSESGEISKLVYLIPITLIIVFVLLISSLIKILRKKK